MRGVAVDAVMQTLLERGLVEQTGRAEVVGRPMTYKAIDRLDAQIVKLLNDRTRHVLGIGEIKLKAGEEIYAPHRERAGVPAHLQAERGADDR